MFNGNLFTVEKILPRSRLELGTAGSAGQRLIYYFKANGAPQIQNVMKTKNSFMKEKVQDELNRH